MTSARRRCAVAVLATVIACWCGLPASAGQAPDVWFGPLLGWLAAIRTHAPGFSDAALGNSVSASHAELERNLTIALILIDRATSPGDAPITYRGHVFEAGDLREMLGIRASDRAVDASNRFLHRAAVYHADVAIWLSRGGGLGGTGTPGASAVLVGDGRTRAETTNTVHWAFGRQLLDHLRPGPRSDDLARRWYLAVSAYLQVTRMVSDADDHLARARQVFPDDARLLFEGACAVETLTTPSLRAALAASATTRRALAAIPSEKSLLGRAESLFARTLEHDPGMAEARVRLARIQAAGGHRDEAVANLRRVLDAPASDAVRYLALMLLGDEEQAAAHWGAARERYAAAAALFPTAQSPLLALGALAREQRDRAATAATLAHLAQLPLDPAQRVDPWWSYYYGMRGLDLRERVSAVYSLLAEEGR